MRYSTLLTKLALVVPARAWFPEFLVLYSTTHIKQDCSGLSGLVAFNLCLYKTTFDRKIMMEVGHSPRVSAVTKEIECDSNDQSHMDASIQTKTARKDERNLSPEERKLARRLRKEAAKEQKKGESLRAHAYHHFVFVHHRPIVVEATGRSQQGRKPCERCSKAECEVLIRCQSKEWQGWKLVCGSCWKDVSGGVPDGDLEHQDYKYGGLWRFRKQD